MPKLLQINSALAIHSTGHITEGIADMAMQRGWDCYIAHGARYVGKTKQHAYQITTKWEEYLHYACGLMTDSHGLHSTRATQRLTEWIDRVYPDVIHIHNIHGYHINYEVLFGYLHSKDIPVVWTFHDCWPFTGHCAYFESVGCEKWKTECHHCALRHGYPKSLWSDNSERNYHLKKDLFLSLKRLNVVSVSSWLDGLVAESFFKETPRYVIYNGIDTEVFSYRESRLRSALGLEGKQVLLAAATAWGKSKGLDDYVELSRRLSDEYRIVLVGLSDKLRKTMPREILALPRTNNAIELAELYSMADISLNLSYQETFGLTTVEAMACGTPGIVYDRTASPELVTPETGMIVKAGDLNALIHAIGAITSKGKNTYSLKCRKRVLNHFDKKDRFNDYIDLYESLINTK